MNNSIPYSAPKCVSSTIFPLHENLVSIELLDKDYITTVKDMEADIPANVLTNKPTMNCVCVCNTTKHRMPGGPLLSCKRNR